MTRHLPPIFFGMIICTLIVIFNTEGTASAIETHDLAQSDMQVRITSGEYAATFRLYNTVGEGAL